jgi:peptidoglycan/LPS O-acetylase OafA/YrhL
MQWVHGPLGLEGIASLVVALAGVVAAAWTLHRLVEEPGIRLGGRLSRRP